LAKEKVTKKILKKKILVHVVNLKPDTSVFLPKNQGYEQIKSLTKPVVYFFKKKILNHGFLINPNVIGVFMMPKIEDRTTYDSSILQSVKKKPLSFISGVLNKHNIAVLKQSNGTLDKPIFFSAKF